MRVGPSKALGLAGRRYGGRRCGWHHGRVSEWCQIRAARNRGEISGKSSVGSCRSKLRRRRNPHFPAAPLH